MITLTKRVGLAKQAACCLSTASLGLVGLQKSLGFLAAVPPEREDSLAWATERGFTEVSVRNYSDDSRDLELGAVGERQHASNFFAYSTMKHVLQQINCTLGQLALSLASSETRRLHRASKLLLYR